MFFNTAYAGTLPLDGTDVAVRWDGLWTFLMGISTFFFILVIGAMIYFLIKYRHRPGVRPKYITGHHVLEAIWIIVPTLLLLVIFGWGYSVYHDMSATPMDAYEIHVIAKQWLWQFQYDNGRTTVGELYVPLNKPVKLTMTSQDVIHSFFVPNFRIKQDVVPGMYTSVWFEARIPGKHQIFCAEYCGTSHSLMLAKVIVLNDAQWHAWNDGRKIGVIPDARDVISQENQPNRNTAETTNVADVDRVQTTQAVPSMKMASLVVQGKHIFAEKGCVSCHSVDGSSKIGPSHKGIYNTMVELTDGRHVLRDENYIRESIEQPQAKLVKGYQPVMPTFKGQLSETEMNALIAYIKSLK